MSKSSYMRGIKWLNDHQPFFTTFVTALGVPTVSEMLPTACVQLNPESDEIELLINPHFFDSMSDAEVGGVLAHEAYHVLYDHLHEAADTVRYPKEKALVWAHECIINDGLVNNLFSLPDIGMFFGPDMVGEDCSGMSTQEAYDLFAKLPQPPQSDKGDGEGGQGGGEGSGSAGGAGADGECPFHFNVDPAALQELADRLDEAILAAAKDPSVKGDDVPDNLRDKMADLGVTFGATDKTGMGSLAGNSASEAEVMMEQNANLNMDWVNILSQIDPRILRKQGDMRRQAKANWAAPRRKTMYAYPTIMLPTIKTNDNEGNTPEKKPTVLLALDFSGSIPASMLPKLAYLANSVPEKLMDVSVVTFSTYTVPFDPKNTGKQKVAGGGTDFGAVEAVARDIEKRTGDYPYVVCITDGQAGFDHRLPTEQHLDEHWFWIGINPSSTNHMKRGGDYYYTKSHRLFRKVYDMPVVR